MMKVEFLIGNTSLSLSEAMQAIDKNAKGILFIVDENRRLAACITDGDIRRHLLSGGKMDDMVMDAANHTPKAAGSMEEAKKLYHQQYLIAVPIVDSEKRILDFYYGEETIRSRKKTALDIPVIINAGGRGTRLDPYTKVLPKPLIPVGEFPIIELIMKEYQKYHCNDFHIIVNYKKDLLKAYFHDNDDQYNITWVDEESPLGTGGGLSLLRGKIKKTFFFANCDALLTSNYESMLRFHRDQRNAITMVCAYKNVNLPYGVVEMGEHGVIHAMKEKPLISFLINTGIYIVEPEVIDDIANDTPMGFPDIIELERRAGKKVAAFPVSENDWMDMGQLTELEKMRKKLYGE